MSATSPESAAREPSGDRRTTYGLIVTALVLAEVVSAFESSMVFVAIPRLMESFDASAADVGWALTAFLLVTAASAVLTGRLGDIFGRRKVLVIVLLISAVGSAVSLLGDSLGFVIAGRALQGVAGGIMPLCFGLARALLPKERVPMAVGLIAGSALIAGALGSVVSGVVVQFADWHWIFVIAGVFAVVSSLITLLWVPRDTLLVSDRRVDWLGAILMPAAVALALLAVTSGNVVGWTSGFVLGLFAAGAVLLAAWLAWSLKSANPLFDVRLLARRDLGMAYVVTIGVALAAMGVTPVVIPIILQSPETAPVGFGISASVTGYISGLSAIIGFVAAPFSGRMAARKGAASVVTLGVGLLVVGVLGMSLFRGSLIGFALSMFVVAIGTGFSYTALPNYVVESIEVERTGEATGFATLLRGTFNAVAAAVVSTILASDVVSGTTYSTDAAYDLLFYAAVALLLICFVVAWRMPRHVPALAQDDVADRSDLDVDDSANVTL